VPNGAARVSYFEELMERGWVRVGPWSPVPSGGFVPSSDRPPSSAPCPPSSDNDINPGSTVVHAQNSIFRADLVETRD